MSNVFISYSRKDVQFVRQLHETLSAQGRGVWVDWEDIPPTADWRTEIREGIEGSEAVIFVISPDSVRSRECRVELEMALENNKRLVPVMHRMITESQDQALVHEALNSHNWVYLREEDDFTVGYQTLANALDTDLSYVREHTRLLVRAREWESRSKLTGFLLTRTEIKEARRWLDVAEEKTPKPTELHLEFISASQRFLNRKRAFEIALVAALIVASVLAVVAIAGFQLANTNRVLAENNQATSVYNERLARQNEATATVAQGEAQIQAATAVAAEATSVYNANDAATQAINADNARATSVVNEQRAIQNASTAIVAQGEAQIQAETAVAAQATSEYNADDAATQAANARDSAATSVYNERLARENETRAIFAQGEAQMQAATAVAAEATSVYNANDAATQAAIATAALGELQLETRRSTSLGLAAQAQLETRGGVQERAVLLGLEALLNYDYTWQAEQALGLSVQSSRIRGILLGHEAPLYSAVYSPDGTKLLTTSIDATARIWDAGSKALLVTLVGHTNTVNSADWSPDGFQVVTASDDGTAIIWDAQTGEPLRTLSGHSDYVLSVDWSPDGSRIATASYDGTARIWDAASGAELLQSIVSDQGALHFISWSPDNSRILTLGNDTTVVLWSARTGAFNSRFRGHTEIVSSADWSPEGNLLVTSSLDKTAVIWEVSSTSPLRTLSGHAAPIYGVDWSPDGRRIATASGDGTVKIWDPAITSPPLTLSVSVVYTVNFSKDGADVVTTGFDNTAKIWRIKPAGEDFTIKPVEQVSSNVQWSPDGRFIAGGVQQSTIIWDATTGVTRYGPMRSRGGNVLYAAWSPDGKQVLVAKYQQILEIWSTESPEEPVHTLVFVGNNGSTSSIAWSPDGSQVAATGLYFASTTVWDVRTEQPLFYLGTNENFVTWSPDGRYILTGDRNTLRFWDGGTGELVVQVDHYGAGVGAWSPDGARILVGNDDGTASIYDVQSMELMVQVSGHIGEITSVDWSPNGGRFITASSDGSAKVWNAENGDALLTLSDNTGALVNADWSPEGNRVVTADLNGDIKVWFVWETLADLIAFAEECCVVRGLTMEERLQFGLPVE
jgi:WD40 repeat protein